ncbi:MAG: hypothetical protein ACYS9X_24840 [Planctomycetota bacterium]|jgi:hypothetical protein
MAVIILLASATGCGDRYLGYGVSAVIERECPEPRKHIIGDFGLDVSVASAGVGPLRSTVAGLFFFPDAHHEHIWGAYVGLDLLRGIHAVAVPGAVETPRLFPTLKVVAGGWAWVESYSNSGPMTGVRAGLGAVLREGPPRTSVLLEFESMFLHTFLDDKSASFQTVGLKAEWSF